MAKQETEHNVGSVVRGHHVYNYIFGLPDVGYAHESYHTMLLR